jgi:lysophospholipase L1-like esterase
MKLRVAVALVIIGMTFAAGWYFSPATTRAYAPRGPGQTYLALGDSLAWGFRLADRARESYPALLAQRIKGRGAEARLVNLSVPGETTTSLRGGQLRDALALIERERAAGRRVSPITLDIGGNDLQRAAGGSAEQREAALAAARENIAATLEALRRARRCGGPRAATPILPSWPTTTPTAATGSSSTARRTGWSG